jgi:hypothetical protein
MAATAIAIAAYIASSERAAASNGSSKISRRSRDAARRGRRGAN